MWALPGSGSCDLVTKDLCVCSMQIRSLGLGYDFHLILVVPGLA